MFSLVKARETKRVLLAELRGDVLFEDLRAVIVNRQVIAHL